MKWVSVENEDFWDEDDAPEFLYYYYGRDGKALTSRWASINGSWYYFNEDGIMQTGSITVDGYNYYLGEDGSRKTGWILLADETDDPEYVESWYYFDNTGKRIENEIDKRLKASTTHLWTAACRQAGTSFLSRQQQSPARPRQQPFRGSSCRQNRPLPAISTTMRTESALPDGEPSKGIEGLSEEAELYRFYFKNGKPYHAEKGLELFTIESRKYAFNTKGEMQTGKKVVNLEDGNMANFYFDEEGVMKTGKQVIFDEDLGETQNWYFHTDGSRKGQGLPRHQGQRAVCIRPASGS